MKFLYELLNDNRQRNLDDDDESFPGEEDQNELPSDEDDDTFPGEEGDQETQDEQEGLDQDDKEDIKDVVNKATENPDKQGAIRVVPGSHLVYKRQNKDGTYEELWMYKNDDMKKALNVRREIISGTDIPVNKSISDDAKQSYNIWSVGDIEMLNISGLSN